MKSGSKIIPILIFVFLASPFGSAISQTKTMLSKITTLSRPLLDRYFSNDLSRTVLYSALRSQLLPSAAMMGMLGEDYNLISSNGDFKHAGLWWPDAWRSAASDPTNELNESYIGLGLGCLQPQTWDGVATPTFELALTTFKISLVKLMRDSQINRAEWGPAYLFALQSLFLVTKWIAMIRTEPLLEASLPVSVQNAGRIYLSALGLQSLTDPVSYRDLDFEDEIKEANAWLREFAENYPHIAQNLANEFWDLIYATNRQLMETEGDKRILSNARSLLEKGVISFTIALLKLNILNETSAQEILQNPLLFVDEATPNDAIALRPIPNLIFDFDF